MKKYLLLFLTFIFFLSNIYCQEVESESAEDILQSFNQDEESHESGLLDDGEFIQVLKWKSEGRVLKYKITIEKKEKKDYEQFLVEETKKNEFVVSLEPGLYRFKVDFYNALRRLAFTTEWEEFEVIEAYQPEIHGVSPKIIYLEEINDGVFVADGKNFRPSAIFELRGAITGQTMHKPLSVEENNRGTKATLAFNMDKIDVGHYILYVENPSGLSSQSEEIRVQFKKPMDLDISAGIAPPYILYDDTFDKYMESNLYLMGLGAKVCFMPIKHRWGYIGIGAIGSATMMDAQFANYSIDGFMFTGHLNLVYQKLFFHRKLMFEAFAGGGLLMFNNFYFHFPYGIESEVLNSSNISADCGLALDFYITKRIFIDLTVQYVAAFISDMTFGMIVPRLSLGYQF